MVEEGTGDVICGAGGRNGRSMVTTSQAEIVRDIVAELDRAKGLHPNSMRLPDGVATSHSRETYRKMAQSWCDRADREGILTHADVFEEEVAEALDARSLADLRKELVQCGAMVLKWLLHIDEWLAAGETATVPSSRT